MQSVVDNHQERPLISLKEIRKEYENGGQKIEVLKGIDINIHRGEYVAIMGRSGAGKSTLMNILGCLDHPTSGEYFLDQQDVSKLHDDVLSQVRGKLIGFVFQSFHLLKNLNICDNVSLPMEYQNRTPKDRRERAEYLLDLVGLSHRFDHLPNALSGGERQRVAVARALSNAPKIILADEPTGNLDGAARDKLLELFENLLNESDVTLLIITHDDLIGELAHRKIVLADGRVLT